MDLLPPWAGEPATPVGATAAPKAGSKALLREDSGGQLGSAVEGLSTAVLIRDILAVLVE
jgi:hypothetical protein